MIFRSLISVAIMMVTSSICFASSPLSLEHTFNGYYLPYNFPVVQESDNDQYFADPNPTFNQSTNTFSTKSYNEDYTVRNSINVTLRNFPSGYEVSTVSYSPHFKMPDGTPVISVSAKRNIPTQMGKSDFAKCWFFNAETGEMITEVAKSSLGIFVLNTVYAINGKKSVVVVGMDYSSTGTSYKTYIYSLGDIANSMIVEQSAESVPYVIAIYDIAGKEIGNIRQASPAVQIIKMSDGTSHKVIHK